MMDDQTLIEGLADLSELERLRAIMHRLRAPGGCAWDARQTHESLIPSLIEEAYEVVAAIRSGDQRNLEEELGDLLLQVVFHAEISQETGGFDLERVARGINEKLIRRHPHVFAKTGVTDEAAVLKQWEEIKKAEKAELGHSQSSYLDQVGEGLPALLKATKLQQKASKIDFDWPTARAMVSKVQEEFEEVQEELDHWQEGAAPTPALRNEIGDLLFIVVNLARKVGVDPEEALEGTNRKFRNRFDYLEATLKAAGKDLASSSVAEMNALWKEAKALAIETPNAAG